MSLFHDSIKCDMRQYFFIINYSILFNNKNIDFMYPNNGNDGEIQSLFDAQTK